MAYTTLILLSCAQGCRRRATRQVWDRNHQLIGTYCRACALLTERRLTKEETLEDRHIRHTGPIPITNGASHD